MTMQQTWRDELKRQIILVISGFVFWLGLMHLLAWLQPNHFKLFGTAGSLFDLAQSIVLIPAAFLLKRTVKVPKQTKPPRDEVLTQAIRERAVDNLISVQRELQGRGS